MAIQPDGSILVGASNGDEQGRPMVVARLTPDGGVDASFGANGQTQIVFWDSLHAASAGVTGLAVTPNGEIVGAGHIDYIGGDGHGSAGVFRLTSSGQLDPSYGTGGGVEVARSRTPDRSFVSWFPSAMALDADGRATVTGDGSPAAGDAILTTRLTASGVPRPLVRYGRRWPRRHPRRERWRGHDVPSAGVADSGIFTLGAGSSFAQLLPDGTPNAGLRSRWHHDPRHACGARHQRSRAARPGTAPVLAGAAGSRLYVGRFLLPAPPVPPHLHHDHLACHHRRSRHDHDAPRRVRCPPPAEETVR